MSQVPLYSLSSPSQYPVLGLIGPDGNPADLSDSIPTARTDPFSWGIVFNGVGIANTSNRVWDSANRGYYWRLWGGGTITGIALKVAVQSGNISVAAYRNSGTGRAAVPGTRLATSGAVACPAVGDAVIPLGASVTLQPGDWFGMSCDNAVASFVGSYVGTQVGTLFNGMGGYQTTAHPLPATPAFTAAGIPGAATLVGVP